MNAAHHRAVTAVLDYSRAATVALPAPPALSHIASVLLGLLLNTWPRLTEGERLALAGAIAVIERHGGGNESDVMAQEAVEARAMKEAADTLRRISAGRQRPAGGR